MQIHKVPYSNIHERFRSGSDVSIQELTRSMHYYTHNQTSKQVEVSINRNLYWNLHDQLNDAGDTLQEATDEI